MNNHNVYENGQFILNDEIIIDEKDVKQVKIEMDPYLLFPVMIQTEDGEERTTSQIVYAHTGEIEATREGIMQGQVRSTRSVHYLKENGIVKRELDLKHVHKVKLLASRKLRVLLHDGTQHEVLGEGNCLNKQDSMSCLVLREEEVPLVEFFDRPSELLNVMKKLKISVVSAMI
ncbi:hypothetical protein M2901_00960 [Vagococcus lutrae]|uniref:hypothetical protein n=1 Tax=Vagococcus lutrae TaxID=81947 RepID=UPI00200C3B73|nr:hypothetical protein [Vagococcus lutrae]UQF71248.1 hypothetical protein M2901_00960 [Vagococcus lutrae]